MLTNKRKFFAQLAEVWPTEVEKKAMIDLVSTDPKRAEAGAKVLSQVPVFNAVLRNGISPTVIEGGKQFNVIPASAVAVLNVRTLPGHSIDKVVNRLRAIVTEPGVTIEVTHRGEEGPASDPGSEIFTAIADAAHELARDRGCPSEHGRDAARACGALLKAFGCCRSRCCRPMRSAARGDERVRGACTSGQAHYGAISRSRDNVRSFLGSSTGATI